MIWFLAAVFAFVNDDLARVVGVDVEIDKTSVCKNDPQAKTFHARLFDRFALHRVKGQYSFRLGSNHCSSVLLMTGRCKSASP